MIGADRARSARNRYGVTITTKRRGRKAEASTNVPCVRLYLLSAAKRFASAVNSRDGLDPMAVRGLQKNRSHGGAGVTCGSSKVLGSSEA